MKTRRKKIGIHQPNPKKVWEWEVERFSPKQAELAAKIANDIAENIDCGESEKDLRMAIDYWASAANDNHMRYRMLQSDITVKVLSLTNQLLEIAAFSDGKPKTPKKLHEDRFKTPSEAS